MKLAECSICGWQEENDDRLHHPWVTHTCFGKPHPFGINYMLAVKNISPFWRLYGATTSDS